MCGIVAIHDPVGDHAALGRRMLNRIRHRGPDGLGWRAVGGTWLGHARLAIVDLPDGDQPLGSGDGHWLVANSEIYNHRRLRTDTTYPYRTGSDSEAALAAAIGGSDAALAALRGMSAFVVAHEDGRVMAARDPSASNRSTGCATGPPRCSPPNSVRSIPGSGPM